MSEEENVGVFLCTCDKALSKNIDFKDVAKALKGKVGVIETVNLLCGEEGLSHIAQHIRWGDERCLDKVIVASCSYRDKGRVFEKLLEHYDLDARSLGVVNLKSMQGLEREGSTEKAKTALLKAVQGIGVEKPRILKIYPDLCNNKTIADKELGIEGCDFCSACPHEAVNPLVTTYNENLCVGCGICTSLCPQGVFQLVEYPDDRIMSRIKEALDNGPDTKILVFSCENNIEAIKNEKSKYSALSPVFLPCIGVLTENHILRSFDLGADGVAVAGCGSNCDNSGFFVAARNAKLVEMLLEAFGIEKRIKPLQLEPGRFELSLSEFVDEIETLGPTKLRGKEPATLNQNKREDLITLMDTFSKKLGIAPKVSIDEKKSYFSGLQINREKCTNCGACTIHCATGALKTEDEKIIFTHSYCTGCKICELVCPENAIVLDGNLNLEKFIQKKREIFEQEMARCLTCGTPFIPKNMLNKIKKAMEEGGAEGIDLKARLEILQYCRNCKDDKITEQINGKQFSMTN